MHVMVSGGVTLHFHNLKVSHPRCVVKNKYVKKILFLQSQNTTKHKTKFITIIVINLVLCLVVFCDCKNKIFFTYLLHFHVIMGNQECYVSL